MRSCRIFGALQRQPADRKIDRSSTGNVEGQYTSFGRITWTKVISNMRISSQIDQYSISLLSG